MLPKTFPALFLAAFLTAGCAGEQRTDSEPSPYAGQENREIKALSNQEINGYLRGRGMGFSKVAELNHYPGPKHVLDLSEKLDLTEAQNQQVNAAFQNMKKGAQHLGQRLIEKEQKLDGLFARSNASKPKVEALLAEIGTLKAELRFVHVRAHMEMKETLTPQQIEQYDVLRGYGEESEGDPQHDSPSHHYKHGT